MLKDLFRPDRSMSLTPRLHAQKDRRGRLPRRPAKSTARYSGLVSWHRFRSKTSSTITRFSTRINQLKCQFHDDSAAADVRCPTFSRCFLGAQPMLGFEFMRRACHNARFTMSPGVPEAMSSVVLVEVATIKKVEPGRKRSWWIWLRCI